MGKKQARIAMIGAGAIGGVTAALIHQAGWDVQIVCKHGDLARKIKSEGIHITGLQGEQRIPMPAVATPAELAGTQDVVFLATKATDAVAAARELLPKLTADSLVVSLQNGISEHALAEVVGAKRVVGCVVGWGASQNGSGELEVTSSGEFVIGTIDQRNDPRLETIREMLALVCPTRISDNIVGELYSKLIINACINSLGVIGGVRLGQLLADRRVRVVFIRLMAEAVAVADAMEIQVEPGGGGRLDFYSFLKGEGGWADFKRHLTIRLIGFKYRRIKSSSLQSIQRGRRTEIDYLNGYICDQGRTHGVATPVNDAVRVMVREIEEGKRAITMDQMDELVNIPAG